MPITTKLVLRESKKREDGKAPVWLRITANRKSRYVSSGIYVEPRHWNDNKRRVRKSHPISNALNARLRKLRLDAEEAALDASTADAVKAEVQGGAGNLTTFFKRFIKDLDDQDKYWEHKKYKVTLGKLHGALGQDLTWADLDREALQRFERHCHEERGNNPNTTRKELTRLHRIVNQAIKEEVLSPGDDPFHTYEMPKRVPPDRRRLTREEMRALEEVALVEESDLELARDAFVFAFYGGGMRFGDVCHLRRTGITDGRLRYRMLKTDAPISLPLPDPAQQIAKRWTGRHDRPFVFPFLEKGDAQDPVRLRKRIASQTTLVNDSIKKVARLAEISKPEEVSTHVARHSFADFARRRSGDLYAVSKSLGHSRLRVTEQYLSAFDQDAVDGLADELWNNE